MSYTTYMVLDESGAMHHKNDRYFVIAGYLTKELHKVTSAHKQVEKEVKKIKGILETEKVEFKASKLTRNQKKLFLDALYDIGDLVPVAIVVDKHNLADFVAGETMSYNYFVKCMLKYLFKCNLPILNSTDIVLRVDNRNVAVGDLKKLETYINWEFEMAECNFRVEYLDSKNNRDVQMADHLAHYIWRIHNYPNHANNPKDITKYYKTYISTFPRKKFGENPSLRQLAENI